ncbi:MAG TPA: hypothetical protein PKK10_00250 [Woeseiaceae bacterium]|nr:hypothetical protein [Woeseiaceae bacterium]
MNLIPAQSIELWATTILVFVLASPAGYAETFQFRVGFDALPGVVELTSGEVNKGIEILQRELQKRDASQGDVLATLCGAYIVSAELYKARSVCAEAVEKFPGETAFNNRGVWRALSGDFDGAKADFDRARPARMDEYLEYLESHDVGLVADGNFNLVGALAAKQIAADAQMPNARRIGADIERLDERP